MERETKTWKMPTVDWKREFFEIFFMHFGLIVWTVLLIMAATVAIVVFWPPSYAATTTVMLRTNPDRATPDSLEATVLRNLPVQKEDVSSELEILTSTDLLRRTLAILAESEGRTASALTPTTGSVTADSEIAQMERIRDHLGTEVVPASKVVRITLTDSDPEWAEKTLDTLINEYLKFRGEVFNPRRDENFFEKRATTYKDQLNQVEEQANTRAAETSVTLADKEMVNAADLKKTIEGQLVLLRNQQALKQKEIEPVEKALKTQGIQYFSFLDNLQLLGLRNKLVDLVAERGLALRTYLPDSEKVKGIDGQIDQLSTQLREEVAKILEVRKAELAAVQAQIDQVRADIDNLVNRNVALQRRATDDQRTAREVQLLASAYETFAKRREEARIGAAITAASLWTDVTVVSKAAGSAELVFPKPVQTLIIGFLVALVTGCSLAFLIEYLNHYVKRPSDVLRNVDVPVVCSLHNVRNSLLEGAGIRRAPARGTPAAPFEGPSERGGGGDSVERRLAALEAKLARKDAIIAELLEARYPLPPKSKNGGSKEEA